MTKINQIQKALLELDGGKFQKLADTYLYKKGYERLTPLGSVIGADKVRKGTPDTFASLPNGKYVLAEYTTQQTDVYKKFEGDLEKCFEVMKTGVPVEEIVFCHTSILSSTERNDLTIECRKYGVNINIFGMGEISYDLYQIYPGLARDFLSVEVDTGQIIPPDEFISIYNNCKPATRLDTAFYFRVNEVNQVIQSLDEHDLVVVSGGAGVGKSRFALECCKQFKNVHSEYKTLCIYSKGQDIFMDLQVHFSEPRNFLILVDDANRISRFDYVVQLLQNQREDQRIKVIVTVRDYALAKVLESASSLGDVPVMGLKLLDDDQIKWLVEKEYGILNPAYLDRIAYIAKGNPRIAIMAAEVAKRKEKLESIQNVTVLYDKYFASIRRDLDELGDRNLLKAAGIVAFFQAVDSSNKEMTTAIQDAFEMPLETFWRSALILHDLEIFDMYGREVVKTSDQILSTYLFYLAFFKEEVLDFAVLLDRFFPKLCHRLVDSINPVLSAFDADVIKEAMCKHVDRTWKSLMERDNKESLLHLMEVFWFLKPTDALLYISGQIKEMEAKEVDPSKLEFKVNSWIPSPSILRVLSSFKYGKDANFRIALDLLFDYVFKRPDELPQVLHLLTDVFGFKHTSYRDGFSVQHAVIDVLWKFTKNGQNDLYSKIFLTVAKEYLLIKFHNVESKGRHAFSMINFQLPTTSELFELRRTIWMRVFNLYQIPALRANVLDVLYNYGTSNYHDPAKEIIMQDAEDVLPFINAELEPKCYRHCVVVHKYLDLLSSCGVPFNHAIGDSFNNEAYKLSKSLFFDRLESRNSGLSHDEYRRLKKVQIEDHFKLFSLSDYEQFFNLCLEIYSELSGGHIDHQIQVETINILLALSDREPDLYTKVIEYYLKQGDPLSLPSSLRLMEKLVEICGAERSYEILSGPDNQRKRIWLFGYYMALPKKEVTNERLSELYTLYQEAKGTELPHSFDFLLKYRSIDDMVVLRITEIILEKSKVDPSSAYALSSLFNSYNDVNKEITEIFAADKSLLKQAYFVDLRNEMGMDYDGQTFTRILDLEPEFILEYIDQIYAMEEMPDSQDDTRDYAFLWLRDDCEGLMTWVAERIFKYELSKSDFRDGHTYLKTFFVQMENGKKHPEVMEKQNQFLKGLIERRHDDTDFMEFIFSVIASFSPEKRCQFVALFLEHNQNFKAFQKLPLEPISCGWIGSAVPMYQKRVEYFESLLSYLNDAQLLQHRQYIEAKIQETRIRIEEEKRRDFMED